MKKAIVVIDLGGNSRVSVLDTDGKMLSLWQRVNEYFPDPDYASGGVYFDVDQWQEDILNATKQVVEEAGEVEILAVTSSSQREGIVLIGNDGQTIAGYPNADMRGIEYIGAFDWAAIGAVTTLPPLPLYSGQKLYGMAKNHPEVMARVKAVCSISDWAGYLFTGEICWEKTQAMHSSLYDIRQEEWSEKLCEIFATPMNILPPLKEAGSLLGSVKPEIAARTGIPAGTKFIVGAADTQIALAAVKAEPGDIVAVNGTTTPLMTPIDEVLTGSFWMSPNARGSRYVLEINNANTGSNLDKLCKQYNVSGTEKAEGLAQIEADFESGKLPPITAMFSQNLFSAENYLTHGGFLLDNPLKSGLTWKDFAYAIILNVAFQIKEGTEVLKKCMENDQTGPLLDIFLRNEGIRQQTKTSGRYIGVGGGFSGKVQAQTLANLIDHEVIIYETSRQATMYGCFNIVCEALGLPEPELKIKTIFKPQQNDALLAYYENWKKYKTSMLAFN